MIHLAIPLLAAACQGTSETGKEVEAPKPPPITPGVIGSPSPKKQEGPEATLAESNCGDLKDGGPVAGPDCVTATITCGQKVLGHTAGGTSRFDRHFYQHHQCTPAFHYYNKGGERAYLLELPDGDQHADIWLDTPCDDLDLAAIRLPTGVTCPDMDTPIQQCDMWPKPGTEREHVRLVSQGGSRWLIVVEGKEDAEGAFGLTVECGEGL